VKLTAGYSLYRNECIIHWFAVLYLCDLCDCDH